MNDAHSSAGHTKVERMLPLYQGMMTNLYDHRAADIVRSGSATQRQNVPRYLTDHEKEDPERLALPQYWIREDLIDKTIPRWILGFNDITASTNARTVVPVALPRVGIGHTFPIILDADPDLAHCLLASLSSFALDFVARQKVGGVHLTYFIFRQLPVLSPNEFRATCPWDRGASVRKWIAPRVAQLVATSVDMISFAEDLEISGAPFTWNPERRALLRAELDAAMFHLYGIARDDVDYIMETFPIVKRHDEAEYGEYRTKRLILEIYDAMAEAMRTGAPYASQA